MRPIILFVLVMSILLLGCSSKPIEVAPVKIEKVIDKSQSIYHPPLPTPISSFPCVENKSCWKVITVEGVPYKAISHNDSLDFQAWMEQKQAYDMKLKNTLCYYRKDLKEEFCK